MRRNFKAAANTFVVPPFRSYKQENATACMGKQRHNYEIQTVPQRIDLSANRGLNGRYAGKEVPDDLAFQVCVNADSKGKQCGHKVCVNMVEAF